MSYFNYNMSSKQSVVSKNIVITNFAVMGNMTRTHDKIVITNNLGNYHKSVNVGIHKIVT